jgi:uncharacterized phiE125 gp8 family phage protein
MALATVANVKDYLKIEHEVEDTMLGEMLAQAIALVSAYCGRPLLKVEQEFVDEADSCRMAGYGVARLLFPVTPVDPETVEVVDGEGATVDDTTYRVKGGTGEVIGVDGARFATPPYTLTGEVGLEAFADYATRVEPVINRAILDTVADWYQHRNPLAGAEGSGGGVYTQWIQSLALPARVELAIRSFRMPT